MASSRSSSDVRARAVFGHRASALAARAAVVVLAFHLTIPLLPFEPAFEFDAPLVATLAGALLMMACGALALMTRRNRLLAADVARLEGCVEELGDRNWELKELAERGRTFLEALGDVTCDGIPPTGSLMRAATAGLPDARRERSLGSGFALTALEQGPVIALPDGTRMHDQKIESPEGPRWIMARCRHSRCRIGDERNQSVGRGVTARTQAEHALSWRATRRRPRTAPRAASSRWSPRRSAPLSRILGMAGAAARHAAAAATGDLCESREDVRR